MKRFCVLFTILFFLASGAFAEKRELIYDETVFENRGVWNCFVSRKSAMKVLVPNGFIENEEKGWDQFRYYECGETALVVGFENAHAGYEEEIKALMPGWESVICNGVPALLNTIKGNGLTGKALCCITEDRKVYVFVMMKPEDEWKEEDEAFALCVFSTVQADDERWPEPNHELEGTQGQNNAGNGGLSLVMVNIDGGVTIFIPSILSRVEQEGYDFANETTWVHFERLSTEEFNAIRQNESLVWQSDEDGSLAGVGDTQTMIFRVKGILLGEHAYVCAFTQDISAWSEEGEALCKEIFDSFRRMENAEIEALRSNQFSSL